VQVVIVKLIGGLGNQLFQYAAGRQLSILHETSLKLDISYFEHQTSLGYTPRRYSLKPFCIQATFATPEEIAAAVKGSPKRGSARIIAGLNRRLNPCYRPSVLAEPSCRSYDPAIRRTARNVYLAGFWQSEKYFADIQEVIRREFTVRHEPEGQNREMAEKITRTPSVSIHVRRGDYVSDARTNHVHGVCSLAYYQKCVDLIAERVSSPHFFVFSDDPVWTRENLHLEHSATFVTHNGAATDYEDLRLMSLCQHNIVANSSFSWWGAWLNTNPDKMVLAPRQWFNDPTIDNPDLIPEGWIKI
jgi:hypothetical protein